MGQITVDEIVRINETAPISHRECDDRLFGPHSTFGAPTSTNVQTAQSFANTACPIPALQGGCVTDPYRPFPALDEERIVENIFDCLGEGMRIEKELDAANVGLVFGFGLEDVFHLMKRTLARRQTIRFVPTIEFVVGLYFLEFHRGLIVGFGPRCASGSDLVGLFGGGGRRIQRSRPKRHPRRNCIETQSTMFAQFSPPERGGGRTAASASSGRWYRTMTSESLHKLNGVVRWDLLQKSDISTQNEKKGGKPSNTANQGSVRYGT